MEFPSSVNQPGRSLRYSSDCLSRRPRRVRRVRDAILRIRSNMRLHAEDSLVAFADLVYLGVAGTAGVLRRQRSMDNRRIRNLSPSFASPGLRHSGI
jgi:hypothetical protein